MRASFGEAPSRSSPHLVPPKKTSWVLASGAPQWHIMILRLAEPTHMINQPHESLSPACLSRVEPQPRRLCNVVEEPSDGTYLAKMMQPSVRPGTNGAYFPAPPQFPFVPKARLRSGIPWFRSVIGRPRSFAVGTGQTTTMDRGLKSEFFRGKVQNAATYLPTDPNARASLWNHNKRKLFCCDT
jgi:hypothetical protein